MSDTPQPAPTGSETYSSAIVDAANYTRWIVDLMRPYLGFSLLEVGLGHGSFRDAWPAQVRYLGTDLDADAVASAAARHPRDGFFVADIAAPEFPALAQAEGAPVDTVVCANVLEHVPDDAAAVANLLAVLQPGGRLLLYLPAHARLYGRMDALAGHHRRYDRSDLERLTGSARLTHINRQIRLFDRYVLPVSRWLTPLTARHFGQSLFCVLEAR